MPCYVGFIPRGPIAVSTLCFAFPFHLGMNMTTILVMVEYSFSQCSKAAILTLVPSSTFWPPPASHQGIIVVVIVVVGGAVGTQVVVGNQIRRRVENVR